MTIDVLKSKGKRGTKRHCRNEECSLPFYDLNKEVVACPHCGAEFDLAPAHEARAEASSSTGWPSSRRAPVYKVVAPEPAPTSEEDETDIGSDADDVLELDDESSEETDPRADGNDDDAERGAA